MTISLNEVTKENNIPDSIPGNVSGMVTVNSVVILDAPRLAAAVSSRLSNTAKFALTEITTNGNAKSVWARINPV
ncbi:hypothetical protein GCM10023078_15310 [Gibbsiella greigii]